MDINSLNKLLVDTQKLVITVCKINGIWGGGGPGYKDKKQIKDNFIYT